MRNSLTKIIITSIALILGLSLQINATKIYDVTLGREISIPTVIGGFAQSTQLPTATFVSTVALGNPGTDFSGFNFFEYEVSNVSGNIPIQFKIALKDNRGVTWFQKDAHLATPHRTNTFLVSLATSNWETSPPSATPFNLGYIQEIQVHTLAQANRFIPTNYLRNGGILCDAWTGDITRSGQNTAFSADITPPTLSNLTVDQKTVVENDYISTTPQLAAIILDTDSGIATWAIQLINTGTNAISGQSAGTFANVTTAKTVTLNVTTALPDGHYRIKVISTDGAGNTASINSGTLVVHQSLSIDNFLNSPNPFNPNRESTQIDYLLSKAADVKLYIYSLNGELQKQYEFKAGETGASVGYNKIIWDGQNQFNQKLANGVYIAYIIAEAEGKVQKGKIKIWVRK